MDGEENKCYYVLMPLEDNPIGHYTAARALTPEGAAEVIRILLANLPPKCPEIVVRVGVIKL